MKGKMSKRERSLMKSSKGKQQEEKEAKKERRLMESGKGKQKEVKIVEILEAEEEEEEEEEAEEEEEEEEEHEEEEGEEDASDSEDWCFVCKDGGTLRLCDFPNCEKSYHCGCVGKKKAFLSSPVDWECDRHSCSLCRSRAKWTCYSCPNAICSKCLRFGGFLCIDSENGLCKNCWDFALHVEGVKEKSNLEVSSTKYKNFKEYYWIIKEKYGFTFDDLQADKNERNGRKKLKSSSSSSKVDINKSPGGSEKIKLDSSDSSQDEKLVTKLTEVAAPVPENVRRIYLTKSVIEKLLKQPESFEARVRRTFFGIELPRKGFSNKRVCQLVQVTGITTSCDKGLMAVKFQAKNIPNDISIDMVSDIDFSENACKDLRQQVKDGLLEMPAIEEFQQMAKDLSKDIVADFIVRETRRLQLKMDQCNEKGWRQQFYEYSKKKKMLQTYEVRLQLLEEFSTVKGELPDGETSEVIMNEKQEINGSLESMALCKNDKIASDPRPILKDMIDDEKLNAGSPKSIACNLSLTKDKSLVGNTRKRLRTSDTVQEQVRKTVSNELVFRAPVCPTTERRVNSQQQFLEMKHKEVFPEENGNGESSTIKQPLGPFYLNSSEAQKSLQVHVSKSDSIDDPVKFSDVTGKLGKAAGIPEDQVRGKHYRDEELIRVGDDHNAQRFVVETEILVPPGQVLEEHERFDVMHEELARNAIESSGKIVKFDVMDEELASNAIVSSEKILMLVDKPDMLEDEMDNERLRLKGTTQEDTGIRALKRESLEEKIDRIVQDIKQIKEVQAQAAQGAIFHSNSSMFLDAIHSCLGPVTSLVYTKTLEEVKAKHLPDLDLRQLPNYDPNALERVHPMFRGTVQSLLIMPSSKEQQRGKATS